MAIEESMIPAELRWAIDKQAFLDQNTLEMDSWLIRVDDLKEILEEYFNRDEII